ncbi:MULTISPECIES: multiubiquitin domain-containing protein [Burkholderia]|uniref:multiubiquitin domain-containing protein n=1 Tax=Burkholderia TaxID=32008 RepID=UPI0005CDEEA5|nr:MULTISPECIES: multiubiquitin domain-containing protein [Burkholderia]MEB2540113.1 multiubiquitin domain-containing protein [Burkholderia cenocepacia]TGN99165.1 hypothetical protein PL79_000385 [Burkholderia sp. USMB20]
MSTPTHTTTIIVNLDQVQVHEAKLTYAQLVHLAYPQDPPADTSDIVYTVTVDYPDGQSLSLARGEKPVPVKEGMVCHVRKTGRS